MQNSNVPRCNKIYVIEGNVNKKCRTGELSSIRGPLVHIHDDVCSQHMKSVNSVSSIYVVVG